MIYSSNREPSYEEFQTLVNKTVETMNAKVKESPSSESYFSSLNGVKLEEEVKSFLEKCSIGTPFQDTIQLISNQSFPDIVAGKYYGVEVKTSQKDWKSIGSSIMESTRVKDVEKIYLLFGKLSNPVEFKARPYEECLSEIVITHKPRYKIDMNLDKQDTIFDKMNVNYDDFRQDKNRINTLKRYYKDQLSEGEDIWWLSDDSENEEGNPFVLKLWSTLSLKEKKYYKVKGFCWFPEILGSSHTKYNRFAFWLTKEQSIIPTSLRDIFSAGGRQDIILEDGNKFNDQPKIYYELATLKDEIINELETIDNEIIKKMWELTSIPLDFNPLKYWISLVIEYTGTSNEEMIKEIFEIND